MQFSRTGLFRTVRFRTGPVVLAFSAIARSEVGITISSYSYWRMFPLWAAQFCRPLPPASCRGYYQTIRLPTVHRFAFISLAIPTRLAAGNHGASQLPDSSLVPCHALGPRQAFGSLTFAVALCWLPSSLTGSPPAFICFVTGLDCFRETRPPLRPGTFPVYASTMPFARAPYNSSRVVLLPCIAARLGTSDRLHLTRRGLAPRKKSQTYAGALTTKAEPRRPICQPRMRTYYANRRRLRRIVRRHPLVT